MKDKKKQRLMDLGSEQLADALLYLASQFDEAYDFVEHLIATPKENIQRFKKKISSIKKSSRFINWDESYEFGRELTALLQDLKAGVDDPFEIGLHTQFVGEILHVKADETVLSYDGVPNIKKVNPLLYATAEQEYFGVGNKIGDAFSIGRSIK